MALSVAQVQILGIDRARLQDDLELIVVLHAVGVLTVAAVGRAAARLRIAGAPGVGPRLRSVVAVWNVPAPTSLS